MRRITKARRQAERLIQEYRVERPPVDVESIARSLGLQVLRAPLGDDVSGLLVTKGGKSTIFVAEHHHENRQRFSIAHEIAHHALGHHFGDEHVHVDRVSMRDAKSSRGTDLLEIEANQFAAALLMPENLVAREMKNVAGRDPEARVAELARRFKVSSEAMAWRLGALGYEAT